MDPIYWSIFRSLQCRHQEPSTTITYFCRYFSGFSGVNSVATRFNFAEVYFNDSVPREFERVVADAHINSWYFDLVEEM
jgi:hypothetical protein